MIDEYICGLHFKIRKDLLTRWVNDYGFKDIEDFKLRGDKDIAYRVYCNSYFQRNW